MLSAVLIHLQKPQLHPIYWVSMSQTPHQPHPKRFRLPTAVYLSRSHVPAESAQNADQQAMAAQAAAPTTPSGFVPLAVGALAQSLAVLAPAPEGSGQRMLLEQIHQYLGQPTLAMDAELPLQPADVTFALQILLSTLSPTAGVRHAVTSTVQSEAIGLTPAEFQDALQQLQSVGVVYPDDWNGDQRQAFAQAILEVQLVEQASQIYFVDEAIAALLSVLPSPRGAIAPPESSLKTLCNQNWSGHSLIVVRGGNLLHLAGITLPSESRLLNRQQMVLRTLTMDDKLKLMVEHLHQALTELLREVSLSPQDIQHVLYVDEVEPSTAIAHWLKKQYPNATSILDGDRTLAREASRLAYGAAVQGLYLKELGTSI